MRRALGAALLLGAAACERRNEARLEERVQLMEGLTLSQATRGAKAWTLRAKTATLREERKTALLDEPKMEFYEKGKAVSLVTARSGEIGIESHEMRLSSSVVLDSYEDKSRLTTESLLYSPQTALLTTTDEVLVRRPEGELRGRGLEAKPDLSEIRVHRQRTVLKEGAK